MASPNANAAPTWASQDQDSDDQNQDPPVHKKPTSEVQEELDAMAASSAVGSPSPRGKLTHPQSNPPATTEVEMETDELDVDADDAAELARNQAAEALNDLANAAVALSSAAVPSINQNSTSVPPASSLEPVKRETESPLPTVKVPATKPPLATTKQKQRPAALLTPTRQSGAPGSKLNTQNRSPNHPASAAAAYRSPLVPSNNTDTSAAASSSSPAIITGVGLGSVKTEDLQSRNGNGSVSGSSGSAQVRSGTPSRADKSAGSEKATGSSSRSAFNSPFTNQPFVSRVTCHPSAVSSPSWCVCLVPYC